MRRRIYLIMLVQFLFIACTVQFVQAQESHKPWGQVRQRWGVPITSLLRPGETRLVVVLDGSPPLPAMPPDGMSQIAWITHLSKVVMRVRVVSRQSMLTPNEDWIETSVKMKILQVLKSTGRRSFHVGQEVSIIEPGGSLDLEGQQIDAIVEYGRRKEVGKEYLIFANLTPDNLLVIGYSSTFEIWPGGFLRWLLKAEYFPESMRQSDYFSKSSLKNVPLKNILEEIRRQADAEK